jgi:hypothetical protein
VTGEECHVFSYVVLKLASLFFRTNDMYISLYAYIMLCYTYTVYICRLCMHKRKRTSLSGPQNQHLNYTMRSVALHRICCSYLHI